MEKTTNLLKLSLCNLSNIKLITININQGKEYGQQSCKGINMDSKAVH